MSSNLYPQRPGLRDRVLSASSWSMLALVMTQGMRFGGNLVMTRLLVPEMFGVMAMATTVSVVLALLSDIGLRQNIIQGLRGDDPVFLNTAWTVQIIRGAILYVATLLVALVIWVTQRANLWPPESTYSAQEFPIVLAVTGLSAILYGLQSTKIATSFRFFQQKRVVLTEIYAQGAALISMLAFGFFTRSIWSLVIASLVASVISAVLSHVWLVGERNRLQWDKEAFKELMHFGRWILLSSLVGVLATHGDRIMFGATMSAAEMGIYSIALLLLGAMEMAVHRLAASVVLPALGEVARNDDHPRFYQLYYRFRFAADSGLLFLCGFLVASGPAVIGLIYDHRYAKAGELLSTLSVGVFFWRFYISHQAWLALGNSKYLALDNLLRMLSLWTLVPVCIGLGRIDWAIWAVALHPIPTLTLIVFANTRLKLIDGVRELVVLPILAVGYLAGMFFSSLSA